MTHVKQKRTRRRIYFDYEIRSIYLIFQAKLSVVELQGKKFRFWYSHCRMKEKCMDSRETCSLILTEWSWGCVFPVLWKLWLIQEIWNKVDKQRNPHLICLDLEHRTSDGWGTCLNHKTWGPQHFIVVRLNFFCTLAKNDIFFCDTLVCPYSYLYSKGNLSELCQFWIMISWCWWYRSL